MWTIIFIWTLFWIGAAGLITGVVLGILEVVFFLVALVRSLSTLTSQSTVKGE